MFRACTYGLTMLGILLFVPGARADHFAIDLKVQVGKMCKTAHAEIMALGVKPKKRGTLTVHADALLTVAWTLRSTATKATVKNVLVHFFVVKEPQAGQSTVPKLNKDVVVESALTLDFQPADKARGELHFTIAQPGNYLVRLETIGAAVGRDAYEHFAALDVLVR
jgi:hypothetical protein